MEDMTLTIDGKEVRGRRGDTILAVCERNGIDVPTLCHTKGLTDIGACRLCVVEIQGARGLNTACTTPASTGMVVFTDTPALNALRKSTLELLFAERNHFCMFCERSGDCELQALGYRFGIDAVRYAYMNPKVEVDSSSPYFILDHNRCVLCRRCVRACAELAGVSALGYRQRGAATRITFDMDAAAAASTCEACGTCVQLCPTGALFDRRSAYKGRLADCQTVRSTCQACSVGCKIKGVVRARTVLRVDGDFESPPTYGLLCAKGRYEALNVAENRYLRPLVRRDGALVEVDWNEALDVLAQGLRAAKATHGAAGVAALATANATSEQLYLLDWVFRGSFGGRFGIAGNEEAAARRAALRRLTGGGTEAEPSFDAIRQADYILVLGADPASTHPVIASIIRRAVTRGNARLALVGSQADALAPYASAVLAPKPGSEGVLVNGLLKILVSEGAAKGKVSPGLASALYRYTPGVVHGASGVPIADLLQVAHGLAAADRPLVLYGGTMLSSADLAMTAISLALAAGRTVQGKIPAIGLARGSNGVAAARLAGARGLYDAAAAQAVFVSLGDAPVGNLAEWLEGVEFLAVHAAYPSALTERAQVILPARTWPERQGTFMAGDRSARQVTQLVAAPEGVRSDAEVFAALGTRLGARASFREAEVAAKVASALEMPPVNLDRATPVCVDYL